MKLLIGFLVLVVLICVGTPASAHDLGLARVTLTEVASGNFAIEAKLPRSFAAAAPHFGGDFRLVSTRVRNVGPYDVHRFVFTGDRDLVASDQLSLPWGRDGVLLETIWRDGIVSSRYLPSSTDGLHVAVGELRQSPERTGEVLKSYAMLGVEHILLGWDHLAFVLGLCLLASGRRLFRLITVFTVGHSITLALAAWGLVRVPIPPVEAGIALTIALLARAVIRQEDHGSVLVLGFGLLHGLGFASALGQTGMPTSAVVPALVAFNVGVEVGQVAFVAVVLVLVGIARQLGMEQHRFQMGTAFALGALAMFWTFERVREFFV